MTIVHTGSASPALLRYERASHLARDISDIYDEREGWHWMVKPHALLGGRCAIDMLLDDAQYEEVKAVIARLRDGAYI